MLALRLSARAYNSFVVKVRVQTTGVIITAVILAMLCLAFSGCIDQPGSSGGGGSVNADGQDDQAAQTTAAEYAWDGPAPESATVAYIGNFRGFLKPCGCAVQQSGGLLRLGTTLAELNERYVAGIVPDLPDQPAEEETPVDPAMEAVTSLVGTSETDYSVWPEHPAPHPVWLVECGNFANPGVHYPAERVKTHLAALATLKQLGFIAAVPGTTELQLTADLAAEAFTDAPVRLTSCNLTVSLPEMQIEPWVEVTPGWYLVGITAWSGGDVPADAWWELSDPVAAAEGVLAQLPDDARVILVAMHQPGEQVRELAGLPITAMIGHGSDNDPQWTDDLIASFPPPPGKGIRLKLAELGAGEANQWDIPLTEEWGDDARIVEIVEGEKERVKEKLLATLGGRNPEGWRDVDWGSSDKYLPDRQGELEAWATAEMSIYVGSRECDKCHPDCYRTWLDTTHSHALLSLIQRDEDETLDCLQCHVAGLLEPSGYDPFSSRDEVSSVTCESCHGPGSKHVAVTTLAEDQYSLDDYQITPGSLDHCLTCHDSYNSPDFERQEYWRQIVHIDNWQDNLKR